MSKLALMLT